MAQKEMEISSNKILSVVSVKTLLIIGVVLLVVAISAAGYFYKQFSDLKKNPNIMAQNELNATIAAVGKLIILPVDEQPTMATVTDPETLKNQPFFSQAQKDDKVLIYTNAKKAILYRPGANKIVEVAPINIGAPVPTTTP